MHRSRDGSSITDVSQILAILLIAFIFSVIAHKAYADISHLSQRHSGSDSGSPRAATSWQTSPAAEHSPASGWHLSLCPKTPLTVARRR